MIKSEQFYQAWVEEFTLATWNMKFNSKVHFTDDLNGGEGVVTIKRDFAGFKQINALLFVPEACETHAHVLTVLKYNLCKWYCFEMDLNYSDESPDFEQALKEANVYPTETVDNVKKSELIKKYEDQGIELDKQVRTSKICKEDAWNLMKEIYHPAYENKAADVECFVSAYKVYDKLKSEFLGTIVNVGDSRWLKIENKTMKIYSTRKTLLKHIFIEHELEVNG